MAGATAAKSSVVSAEEPRDVSVGGTNRRSKADETMVPGLESALRRLDQAIATLESAVEGHGERLRRAASLEHDMHQMGLDRSRLAQSLDDAESRAASAEARFTRLAEVNSDISAGLAAAIASVRGVLKRNADGGESELGSG